MKDPLLRIFIKAFVILSFIAIDKVLYGFAQYTGRNKMNSATVGATTPGTTNPGDTTGTTNPTGATGSTPTKKSATAKYGSKTPSGNARIFNCKQCNRAFTREEHLTRHTLSTHNKLKPFICGICSRPFSRRDLLLRHAKNLHQGSELAVSRLRRSYKKNKDGEEIEIDEDAEADEEVDSASTSSPTSSNSEVDDNISSATSSTTTTSATDSKPKSDTHPETHKLDQYETPEKKRLKMSVNMLVS